LFTILKSTIAEHEFDYKDIVIIFFKDAAVFWTFLHVLEISKRVSAKTFIAPKAQKQKLKICGYWPQGLLIYNKF
jgi:hypothetical protein